MSSSHILQLVLCPVSPHVPWLNVQTHLVRKLGQSQTSDPQNRTSILTCSIVEHKKLLFLHQSSRTKPLIFPTIYSSVHMTFWHQVLKDTPLSSLFNLQVNPFVQAAHSSSFTQKSRRLGGGQVQLWVSYTHDFQPRPQVMSL